MSYEPPGGAPPPPPPGWQPPPPSPPYPASTYPSGSYAYTPTTPTQSTKGVATALTILLAAASIAAVFVVYAFLHRASVVDDLNNATFQDISDADSLVSGTVVFFGLAMLGAGVLWIIWQFRYAKNAERLRGSYGLQSGWAIGGWFVPLANFALPQLQLLQATRASDPDLPQGEPPAHGRAPSLLVVWWVLLDLAWLFFSFGRATRPGNEELINDLDRFVRADRISALSAVLWIATGIVAIVLVRACTARQTEALSRVVPPSPPPASTPSWPAPSQQQPQPLLPPPPSGATPQWPPPPPPPPPPPSTPQWPPPPPPPPPPS